MVTLLTSGSGISAMQVSQSLDGWSLMIDLLMMFLPGLVAFGMIVLHSELRLRREMNQRRLEREVQLTALERREKEIDRWLKSF